VAVGFQSHAQFSAARKVQLQVRADVQNIFNHAEYGQAACDWSTAQFGQIVSPATPSA